MKPIQCKLKSSVVTALGCLAGVVAANGQSADALINKLVQKGILSDKEAKELIAESTPTNPPSASKWRINDAIKNIQLFGDIRLRYEYRGAENAPGSGSTQEDYYKERFRYAVRLGLKGDLYDNFYYGLRLDTSTNPRSTWVTMGDDSNPTPFAKNSDGVFLGQAYLGWRPSDWYEMTVGRMPMPLYVTPMLWDGDLNPEGAVEKFKFSTGNVDLFANLGQFLYQNTSPDHGLPSSDTFMLAWQVGANVKLAKDISFKMAPVIYNYTGVGGANGLNKPFSGQGLRGINVNTNGFNQNGINDLLVLETPAELNFDLGKYKARLFGDFAYNFLGDDRARAAFTATAPAGGLPHAFTGENLAYQVGFGFGNLGLVYGQTSKKNTWEARVYWQHVEQYAADVNLLDSDFFEGRGNLQGIYSAFAYSFTDNIIGTVRYGYANRINNGLDTGGNNPDIPILNPIKNYHLLQLDLTWRF
jgi:hypothetical protein